MKKIRLMLITIASVMVMAGCGNAIPELTEDQRAQVVEYSAMLLLKYDKNYRATMLDQDEVYKQEEKIDANAAMRAEVARQKEILEQQAFEESQGDSGDDGQGGGEYVAPAPVYADIDEVLGLSGVDIEFDHYTVCKSYPELTEDNSWQGVCYASGSNSLVVFTFNITNNMDVDYYLDMASMDKRFTFKVDGISKTPLTTLLFDDFINYRDTIGPGETKQAVIVIEMSPDDADAIGSVTMKIKYADVITETTLL